MLPVQVGHICKQKMGGELKMRRRLGLLLVVAILLVGCSTYEREMVPPKIDLGSSRRIAVLFFLIILRMIILWYMKSKSDYLKAG